MCDLYPDPKNGQEMFCMYRLHAVDPSKTLIRAAPRYPVVRHRCRYVKERIASEGQGY